MLAAPTPMKRLREDAYALRFWAISASVCARVLARELVREVAERRCRR